MTEDRAAGHQTRFFSSFLVPVLKLFFCECWRSKSSMKSFFEGKIETTGEIRRDRHFGSLLPRNKSKLPDQA